MCESISATYVMYTRECTPTSTNNMETEKNYEMTFPFNIVNYFSILDIFQLLI